MKTFTKLLVATAFLLTAVTAFAAEEVYDVNFALASNGTTITATSAQGRAASAIDGNNGTSWESEHGIDDVSFVLDFGQQRVFNTVQMLWEAAYGKHYKLFVSDDGENFKEVKEVNESLAGFPYMQTVELEKQTARYLKWQGIERGTQYGYNLFEIQVLLPGEPVLTTFKVATADVVKVGEETPLTITALDQNGIAMSGIEITYTITPADAATITDGKLTAAKKGSIQVKAEVGALSSSFSLFAYEGENLAKGKTVTAIDGSENPDNAVDENEGSMWVMPDVPEANHVYDAWLQLDLGDFYNLDLVYLYFEGACAQDYTLQFSQDADNWITAYTYVGKEGVDNRKDYHYSNIAASHKVRYIKVFITKAATGYGVKIRELQVYGTPFDASDTTQPVLTKAELVDKGSTWVKIAVEATDDKEVFAYLISESAHAIFQQTSPDNDGNILIKELTEETAYTFVVKALDASLNESDPIEVNVTTSKYYTVPNIAAPVPAWPANQVRSLYSDAYTFAPDKLKSYNEGWYRNPSLTEENMDNDKFLHYNGDMQGMIGWQYDEFMCPTMEKLHVDIWPSQSGSVTVGPTTGGSVPTIVASKTVQVIGGEWNSIDFDIAADFPTLDLFHLFQFQFTGYGTQTDLSVDNVYFYRTSPFVDEEAPTDLIVKKGEATMFGTEIFCTAKDNSGVVSFVVKNGEEVITRIGARSGIETKVVVAGLKPSTTYQLSVSAVDEADNASAAQQLEITTLDGPSAAPAPSHLADEVISLYSDAYTPATGFNIGGWEQATQVQAVSLDTDEEAFYLTNTNYLGWELTSHIDVSQKTTLHVDIYPVNATALSITPISADPTAEGEYKMTLKQGEWNSFDIPLSSFPTVKFNDIFQMKFFNAAPDAAAELFVDNVYFWGSATAVENLNAAAKVQKLFYNNQIIILRDGKTYNLMGIQLK